MDKLEEALKIVLDKEAERFEPIRCNITNRECKKCQPLCINRQRQERERATTPREQRTNSADNRHP